MADREKEPEISSEEASGKAAEKSASKRIPDAGEELHLGRFLGPTSLLDLKAKSKEQIIRALSDAVARDWKFPHPQVIHRVAMERESVINTYLGEGVAVPHARVANFEGFAIAIARHPAGFPYWMDTTEPVKLVILLVGDESLQNEHVRLLAAIATTVKDEARRMKILQAADVPEVVKLLEPGKKGLVPRRRPHHLSRLLLSHAQRISKEVGATSVIVAIENPEELSILKRIPRRETFIVAAFSQAILESAEKLVKRVIRLPWAPLRRDSLVRLGTLIGASSGVLSRDDVVAFLSRQAAGDLDTITILDIAREFGKFLTTSGKMSSKIFPGVLERVLLLASELGSEGREGKPVGTIFVVGDPKELAPFCQQMVINPFRGYPPEERNIFDPTLQETIKEFSWLDGAFIIRGDGLIHSAGTYLRPGKVEVNLPSGLGSRHRAACAITSMADCFSLAISQSTGNVMLFKKGEVVLTLEKGASKW